MRPEWRISELARWPRSCFRYSDLRNRSRCRYCDVQGYRVQGRLRLLGESESLFNDGVAAVLFGQALAWALASGSSTNGPVSVAIALVLTSGGGIAIGLALGAAVTALAGRTTDLTETALTTVAAYGSFLLAERFHCSGVLATVAAGLLMGNFALRGDPKQHFISGENRRFLVEFWEFAAFLANSFVFLMIGVTVAGIPFVRLGVTALSVAIGLVLIGRLLTVYPLCLLFSRSKWSYRCANSLSFGGAGYAARAWLWLSRFRGPWHFIARSRLPHSASSFFPLLSKVCRCRFFCVSLACCHQVPSEHVQGPSILGLAIRLPTENIENYKRTAKNHGAHMTVHPKPVAERLPPSCEQLSAATAGADLKNAS